MARTDDVDAQTPPDGPPERDRTKTTRTCLTCLQATVHVRLGLKAESGAVWKCEDCGRQEKIR